MAKNDFLKRQQAVKQGMLDVGMDTGFQKCWDLIQIVLHDPKVMGKDVFQSDTACSACQQSTLQKPAPIITDNDNNYGVRPVITISTDDIK